MTIDELGSIGELIAAAATVATLAYLATQIRYARLAASDTSRQARAEGVRDMLLMLVANPEVRATWYKSDPGAAPRMQSLGEHLGLSPDEAYLVWNNCCAWTFIHWAQYRSIKTEEDENELENLVRAFYTIQPMSAAWEHDPLTKALLDPGFVRWVDGVLDRSRGES